MQIKAFEQWKIMGGKVHCSGGSFDGISQMINSCHGPKKELSKKANSIWHFCCYQLLELFCILMELVSKYVCESIKSRFDTC